ncbi:MAG: hypothetical protein ACXWDI_15285 [Nocardioides sp.]
MAGTEHERRRFITRHQVEDAAAAGRAVQLRGRDVLTDEAAQRAMDLGVAIEREGSTSRPVGTPLEPGGGSGPASTEDLRRAVRAAVVAELGSEPAGLDAAIDRVLQRRG